MAKGHSGLKTMKSWRTVSVCIIKKPLCGWIFITKWNILSKQPLYIYSELKIMTNYSIGLMDISWFWSLNFPHHKKCWKNKLRRFYLRKGEKYRVLSWNVFKVSLNCFSVVSYSSKLITFPKGWGCFLFYSIN